MPFIPGMQSITCIPSIPPIPSSHPRYFSPTPRQDISITDNIWVQNQLTTPHEKEYSKGNQNYHVNYLGYEHPEPVYKKMWNPIYRPGPKHYNCHHSLKSENSWTYSYKTTNNYFFWEIAKFNMKTWYCNNHGYSLSHNFVIQLIGKIHETDVCPYECNIQRVWIANSCIYAFKRMGMFSSNKNVLYLSHFSMASSIAVI